VVFRVVFAEDNYLLREGVTRLIEAQPELELVGVCSHFDELQATFEATAPDVVITDIRTAFPPKVIGTRRSRLYSSKPDQKAAEPRGATSRPGLRRVDLSASATRTWALHARSPRRPNRTG